MSDATRLAQFCPRSHPQGQKALSSLPSLPSETESLAGDILLLIHDAIAVNLAELNGRTATGAQRTQPLIPDSSDTAEENPDPQSQRKGNNPRQPYKQAIHPSGARTRSSPVSPTRSHGRARRDEQRARTINARYQSAAALAALAVDAARMPPHEGPEMQRGCGGAEGGGRGGRGQASERSYPVCPAAGDPGEPRSASSCDGPATDRGRSREQGR
jgi:hypothetical protein